MRTRSSWTIILCLSSLCCWYHPHHSPTVVVDALSIPHYKSTPYPPITSTAATTSTSSESYTSISAQIEALTQHPAVWSSSKSARKKLTPRHLDLFSTTTTKPGDYNLLVLFNEFASVVCATGRIPRKELFETWAAALLIDNAFSQNYTRRIADVAAGHGLLAWALLVIDDNTRSTTPEQPQSSIDDRTPRTVLCIDKRMPPSAQIIQDAMLQNYPHLEERFHFVQGSLEQIQPHSTCLLASVHACGTLSDLIVSLATSTGAPVAVVPCCHSRKKLDVYSVFAKAEYEAIIGMKDGVGPMVDLAERLDEARCVALGYAGFDVMVEMLPERFTKKNRLIMASPPPNQSKGNASQLSIDIPPPQELTTTATTTPATTSKPKNVIYRMPPLLSDNNANAKTKFLAKMTIPCEDSHTSRTIIATLAGKYAANRRMDALHRKDHTDAPEHNMSIWLPSNTENEGGIDDNVVVSEAALSVLGGTIDPKICCTVQQLGPTFQNSSGRRATTFRIRYEYDTNSRISETNDGDGGSSKLVEGASVSNDDAKLVHDELYSRIADSFPGAECR